MGDNAFEFSINIESNCSCTYYISDATLKSEYLQQTHHGEYSLKKIPWSGSDFILKLSKKDPGLMKGDSASKTYRSINHVVEIRDLEDGVYDAIVVLIPNEKFVKELIEEHKTNPVAGIDHFYFINKMSVEKVSIAQLSLVNIDNKSSYSYELMNNEESDYLFSLAKQENDKLEKTESWAYGGVVAFVNVCHLRNCYLGYVTESLRDYMSHDICLPKDSNSKVSYYRDLLRIALDAISYLVECDRLDEAARIINILFGCNGICKNSKDRSKSRDCGCQPA